MSSRRVDQSRTSREALKGQHRCSLLTRITTSANRLSHYLPTTNTTTTTCNYISNYRSSAFWSFYMTPCAKLMDDRTASTCRALKQVVSHPVLQHVNDPFQRCYCRPRSFARSLAALVSRRAVKVKCFSHRKKNTERGIGDAGRG